MSSRGEERYTVIVGAAVVAALILVSLLIWFLKRQPTVPAGNAATVASEADRGSKKDKKKKGPADAKRFPIEGSEPSGVAWVRGSDQVLMVDDRDASHVLAARIDENGDLQGDVTQVDLGVQVEDAEDITSDGTYFYAIGSQFRKSSSKGAGLVRFRYDATTKKASDVTSISGLAQLLVANVPQLASTPEKARSADSINIEGMGWDANGGRLLLGFRNPVVDGKALIVPVALKDANAGMADGNLAFQQAITIDLGGQAIRSIEPDGVGKFLIIAGEPEGEKAAGFSLWSWDGSNAPTKFSDLEAKIKPEGITPVEINGSKFLFVVGDAGYTMRLDEPN
jgi:hypothetical protein